MNLELFSNKNEPMQLDMPDAEIQYYPNFFDAANSDIFFSSLLKTIDWKQDLITVFGKTYPQPRLTALYSNTTKTYSYSGITMSPKPFNDQLLAIKREVEDISKVLFTSCLLNLYRDGKDSNGWHSDNEKELGTNPVIASITLGQERYFHLKHRTKKELKHKMLLQHGSLLLMQGETQHHWLHQIPKTANVIGERINLTFRVIK